MNQTASECNEIASVEEQLKAEYDKCIFNVETAKGRKQAVYWAHRATELRQIMDSKNAYKYEYSGIC